MLNENNRLRRRYKVAVIFIVIAFLGVSIFFYSRFNNLNHQTAQSRFSATVDTRVWLLHQQLESYVNILYGTKALTDTVPSLSRNDWNKFVDSQSLAKRFPSIGSVSYVQRVTPATGQEFMDKLNSQRLPSDKDSSFEIQPAPSGDSYDITTYIAPSNVPQTLIGYNQSSDPARQAAFSTAATSNSLAASDPLKLISKSAYPGLLVIIPVHSSIIGLPLEGQAVAGFSVLSIDLNNLFGSVFDQKFVYGPPSLVVSDITAQRANIKPFYSFNTRRAQTSSDFVKTVNLDVANRKWRLYFYAPLSYGLSTNSKLLPLVAIGAGDLVILLTVFLVFFAVRSPRTK